MLPIDPTAAPHPAEDYAAMRTEALTAIERLGSDRWTDYNYHDPGITLTENLLYALTEIGYRGQFDVADLLTGPGGAIGHRQPFFTARHVLTGAPLTNDDYRRLLIDSLGLSNAWAICKGCACSPPAYAECADDELSAAPRWRLSEGPVEAPHDHPVIVRGFTDLYVQLAPDAELGNLNSHRLDGHLPDFAVELRIPEWRQLSQTAHAAVTAAGTRLEDVTLLRFSRDATEVNEVENDDFRRGIRSIFFLDVRLTFRPASGPPIVLELTGITLRLWPRDSARLTEVDPAALVDQLLAGDLMARYLRKIQRRAAVVTDTAALLHANRRSGEDYCRFDLIRAEDVAVCADLHLAPDADVEVVLARFYRTIERLLNPAVPFRTLAEMEALGIPTEDIFTGPRLERGFILQEDLDAARLRSEIRVSDLINELMDIEGVTTLEGLRFTVYDADGLPVMPSHEWTIPVSAGHYPALYLAASAVSVYKDGLPLLPRRAELRSLLAQLRAEDQALALPTRELDYPVPTGVHRPAPDYLPVQRTLPPLYGLSEEGLGADAGAERISKARQLAGYLLPFEAITAATAAQLDRFGDLFSTDEGVGTTFPYVSLTGAGEPLAHLTDALTPGTTPAELSELMEPRADFIRRRGAFLDHLLGRFGESLTDYSLLFRDPEELTAYGPERLIRDKVRFLRFYPTVSGRRGMGIDYRRAAGVCTYRNRSGLGERLRRLLGMDDVRAHFRLTTVRINGVWRSGFTMEDAAGAVLLNMAPALRRPNTEPTEPPGIGGATATEAENLAWEVVREVIERATDAANYADNAGTTELRAADGEALAELVPTTDAATVSDFVATALRRERLYVVEHILLRPKFPGDALMAACVAEDCDHRELHDPYSFRLSFLLPADTPPYDQNMDLRRYADRLIRRETPAHLLPKICWVTDPARFETAWCAYLEANRAFDWTLINDELESAVLSLLPGVAKMTDLRLLLGYYGENLRTLLATEAAAETELSVATRSNWAATVWSDFTADLVAIRRNDSALYARLGLSSAARLGRLRDVLEGRYAAWLDISFLLHRLLLVLGDMTSAYPTATLHDCDDGDDDVPVRLDQTSLGTL